MPPILHLAGDPAARRLAVFAWVEETETDPGAGQVEQTLKQIGAPLVADPEATTAEQLRERALDNPAVPAQSLARVDAASSDAWGDAPGTEGTP